MHPTTSGRPSISNGRVSLIMTVTVLILAAPRGLAQWGPVVQLSHTDVASTGPRLTVCGSFVHAIWYDQVGGTRCAAYRRSTDGGASWDSVMMLRGDPGAYKYADYLAARNGGPVHFAYDSSLHVYYRRSTNNGATWSSGVALCTCSVDMYYFAQNSSAIFVAYHDLNLGTLFAVRSTDDGVTWSQPSAIARFSYSVSQRTYFITDYPPVLFFAFERYDGGDTMFLTRSTDNGASWGNAVPAIAFQASGDADWSLAAEGRGRLHVGWEDNRTGNWEIYYSRSTDNGTTWSPADRRTTTTGAFFNNLRASGDMVYLCYQSYVPPGGQQRSTDAGLSWTEGDFAWAEEGNCVAFGDANWVHYGSSKYSRSKDGGSTWPYSYDLSPEGFVYAMALSGGNVHLCWTSYVSGNYEVYYCHGTGLAGVYEYLPPVVQEKPGLSAYPNPFSDKVVLGCPSEVGIRGIEILDGSGRLVRRVLPARVRPTSVDRFCIVWDGTGDDGRPLPSGCYFCRLAASRQTAGAPVVLLRR